MNCFQAFRSVSLGSVSLGSVSLGSVSLGCALPKTLAASLAPPRRLGFCTVLFACLLIALLSGCVRYTHSQREIAASSGSKAIEGEIVADKDAFTNFEKDQLSRVQNLLTSRIQSGSEGEKKSSYRVGNGDVLEFNVFDVEEFKDTTVRVRPSGFIALPLIGAVQVGGMTEAEVQEEVTKRLSQFLRRPQVNVFISEYAANKVNVIGEVAKPGAYVLKRNDYSLIELLSEAGGRKENASGRLILIPSREGTNPEASLALNTARTSMGSPLDANGIEIYFDDLIGSSKQTPLVIPLRAGDTIVVPEAGEVQIDGEVRKPGSVQLSARTSLLGAIASAGGLTYAADVGSVEVIRELESGKKALLSVDLENLALAQGKDVRLRDGDIVRVPSQGGRFAAQRVVDVVNNLLGIVPIP